VRVNLLLQVRMYTQHPNKRTQELAQIILKNIGDKYTLDVSSWIQSLELVSEENEVLKKLKSENITLDQLLNAEIGLETTILSILQSQRFKSGIVLKMIASLAQIRKENIKAEARAIELAAAVNTRERQIATENNRLSLEDAELRATKTTKKAVFLSYCWANKQIALKLYSLITEKGFDCWIDDNKMKGGSELFGEIDNGISGCQVFVACWSNNYGSSVNCQRELLLSTDRKKLIIPVLVATCDPWPPKGQMGPLLAGKIFLDLSTDEKFEKTVEQLTVAISQSLN